jgi:hypothetical protein
VVVLRLFSTKFAVLEKKPVLRKTIASWAAQRIGVEKQILAIRQKNNSHT